MGDSVFVSVDPGIESSSDAEALEGSAGTEVTVTAPDGSMVPSERIIIRFDESIPTDATHVDGFYVSLLPPSPSSDDPTPGQGQWLITLTFPDGACAAGALGQTYEVELEMLDLGPTAEARNPTSLILGNDDQILITLNYPPSVSGETVTLPRSAALFAEDTDGSFEPLPDLDLDGLFISDGAVDPETGAVRLAGTRLSLDMPPATSVFRSDDWKAFEEDREGTPDWSFHSGFVGTEDGAMQLGSRSRRTPRKYRGTSVPDFTFVGEYTDPSADGSAKPITNRPGAPTAATSLPNGAVLVTQANETVPKGKVAETFLLPPDSIDWEKVPAPAKGRQVVTDMAAGAGRVVAVLEDGTVARSSQDDPGAWASAPGLRHFEAFAMFGERGLGLLAVGNALALLLDDSTGEGGGKDEALRSTDIRYAPQPQDEDIDDWVIKSVKRANDGTWVIVGQRKSPDGEPGTAAWMMTPVLR